MARPNQVSKGTNFLRTLPTIPSEPPNLVTKCPVKIELSSSGSIRIESLFPRKMVGVQLVLNSTNVKVVKVNYCLIVGF